MITCVSYVTNAVQPCQHKQPALIVFSDYQSWSLLLLKEKLPGFVAASQILQNASQLTVDVLILNQQYPKGKFGELGALFGAITK